MEFETLSNKYKLLQTKNEILKKLENKFLELVELQNFKNVA